MASPQQIRWQDVQGVLGGQPIGQVTFAQNVVWVGANQGGVINVAAPGQQAADRIRPCRERPRILPRAVPGFLDREQEQGLVSRALARGQVIDMHGPDGMGKTALISQTMQTQLPSAFPDGSVYLSARHETYEDLLQDLFKSFFETDGDVRVTENDARRYMAGKRALIAVDDANYLGEGGAEALAQVAPQCALLIAGREQQVWQETVVTLQGLPRDEAVALFERHGGPVSAQDRPTVEAICDALGGVPLAIIKTATTAAKRPMPLAQVLQQVQPRAEKPDPMGQAFWTIAGRLSEGEQRVLGALAAPGGTTVGIEALPVITGLPPDKIGQYLNRLQKMGLVHAHSPRYSLDNGLRPYARHAWADEEMQARAADYYLQKAHDLQGPGEDPDEENVMGALGHYYRRNQWGQVVHIARAVDSYLATTGRWGQWRQRLNQAWQAAREIGDRATEAWAQNQLGIIAMSLGDIAAATKLFRGALRIWRALGDRAGMTIARWNLQILLGPPPPPPGETKPGGGAGGGRLIWPLALTTLVTVAVLIGLVIAVVNHGDRTTPTAPPPSPPPTTIPPPPTTEVPPQVELWLAAGCDRTYSPDGALPIRLQSTVDGQVDVFWTDPQGERQFLFGEQVVAGRITSRDWDVPAGEGNWVLEADLNRGQADARCGFTVELPVTPQVQIWLDKGCNRAYLAGEALTIQVESSVDGVVDLVGVNPDGGRGSLFTREVRAGQVASQNWVVPTWEGEWILEADLNGGQASARCAFSVKVPQVEVWLRQGCGEEVELGSVADIYFQASVDGRVTVWLDEQQRLFEREVTGDTPYLENWPVAVALGEHLLTAVLEEWEVSGECPFSVSDRTPPPAPIPLKPVDEAEIPCSGEPTSLMLRWEPVSDPSGIARYDVELVQTPYYPPVPSTSTLQLEGSQAEALISGNCGDGYSWRVRAVDGAGNVGDWSSTVSFRIMTLSESDQDPPPIPVTIGPGNQDPEYTTNMYPCSQVVLDWYEVSDSSGIQGYRVSLERYSYSPGQWESIEPYFLISDTSIDVVPWLSIGYRYRWRVWAIDNANNQGDPSSWLYFSCPEG